MFLVGEKSEKNPSPKLSYLSHENWCHFYPCAYGGKRGLLIIRWVLNNIQSIKAHNRTFSQNYFPSYFHHVSLYKSYKNTSTGDARLTITEGNTIHQKGCVNSEETVQIIDTLVVEIQGEESLQKLGCYACNFRTTLVYHVSDKAKTLIKVFQHRIVQGSHR